MKFKNLHYIICLIVIIISSSANAQFNFTLTKSDETCPGNGSISIELTPNNQASYSFLAFLHPYTDTPFLITSNREVQHLSSGTYTITGLENLNGEISSVSKQITIDNLVVPLQFNILEHPTECDGVSIEIVVENGSASSYEIITTSQLYPPQTSNIFHGLLSGETYQIRVFDRCGEAYVRTHTIITDVFDFLNIGLRDFEFIDCEIIKLTFTTNSTQEIENHQIKISYTQNNQQYQNINNWNISEGRSTHEVTLENIPPNGTLNLGIEYLSICNDIITLTEEIDLTKSTELIEGLNECGEVYFTIGTANLIPPISVNIVSAPEEFVPNDYNQDHPNFTESFIIYGMQDFPLPLGDYSIEIQDQCGFFEAHDFTLEYKEEYPITGSGFRGCSYDSSYLTIRFATDRMIAEAHIVSGPDEYGPYPIDTSFAINENGNWRIEGVPSGTYTIEFTDSCGFSYSESIDLLEINLNSFTYNSMIGCQENTGSIRLSSYNGHLSDVIITEAPLGFPHSLPFHAVSYINSNGVFYIPNIPSGNYVLWGIDTCMYEETITIEVINDIYNQDLFIEVEKLCNTFNLTLQNMNSQHAINPMYWLQYFDITNQQWVHPYTLIPQTDPNIFNQENAIEINPQPSYTLYNIGLQGEFRIAKTYRSMISDSPFTSENCTKTEYFTFDYYNDLRILEAYSITCSDQGNSVVILADGIAPLQYEITSYNSVPVSIENGNEAVFNNLQSGVYNFQVSDQCGNIRNREFNIDEIQNLITSQTINIPEICLTSTPYFEFTSSDYFTQLLNPTIPIESYTISLHSTFTNALNNFEALPETHQLTQSTTFYYRISNVLVPGCISIASIHIPINNAPNIEDNDRTYILCSDEEFVTIDLTGIADHFEWFDGSTLPTYTFTDEGIYTVEVRNGSETSDCTEIITIRIIKSIAPESILIDFYDWTSQDNSIEVNVKPEGMFYYSIDGINFQNNPKFEHLAPGQYMVYVQDLYGCQTYFYPIAILNYPKFFTPNEDGYNDHWQIEYSWLEPDMKISIFDRYGKLLAKFKGQDIGWDGNHNGEKMFSNDYWFLVERKDGSFHRGHFTLKR